MYIFYILKILIFILGFELLKVWFFLKLILVGLKNEVLLYVNNYLRINVFNLVKVVKIFLEF